MALVVVRFKKHWGQYNPGEQAGFTEAELAERVNVGAGPEQTYRIPREVFETIEPKGEPEKPEVAPTPADSVANPPEGFRDALSKFNETDPTPSPAPTPTS